MTAGNDWSKQNFLSQSNCISLTNLKQIYTISRVIFSLFVILERIDGKFIERNINISFCNSIISIYVSRFNV